MSKVKILVYSIIIGVFAFSLMFSSCSKSKTLGKLNGKWKVIDVANVVDTAKAFYETWDFGENQVLTYSRKMKYNMSDSLVVLKGTYNINKYNKVTISDFNITGFSHLNGTWNIIRLKNGNMMMVNDLGGLYFREFTKM